MLGPEPGLVLGLVLLVLVSAGRTGAGTDAGPVPGTPGPPPCGEAVPGSGPSTPREAGPACDTPAPCPSEATTGATNGTSTDDGDWDWDWDWDVAPDSTSSIDGTDPPSDNGDSTRT
ncbi:hypothetical protein [Streptomyces sp. NPDC056632]|uniref:hypothetical protein n=1 Tax=Streptomyces sp. NPDC056632 TaxID=3345884 RepID=UPI003689FBE4